MLAVVTVDYATWQDVRSVTVGSVECCGSQDPRYTVLHLLQCSAPLRRQASVAGRQGVKGGARERICMAVAIAPASPHLAPFDERNR